MAKNQCIQSDLFLQTECTKTCTGCGEEKPLDCFSKRPSRPCGIKSKCKQCLAKTPRHLQDRKNEKKKIKRWIETENWHPKPKLSDKAKKTRRFMLRKLKYGITQEEYSKLNEEQCGVCAICRNPQTTRHKNGTLWDLCVDHDHETGKVRGLLCQNCNGGLGQFKDKPENLRNALAYLTKHEKV